MATRVLGFKTIDLHGQRVRVTVLEPKAAASAPYQHHGRISNKARPDSGKSAYEGTKPWTAAMNRQKKLERAERKADKAEKQQQRLDRLARKNSIASTEV